MNTSPLPPAALHVNLDDAWPRDALNSLAHSPDYLDCREWGPQLRYSSTRAVTENFFEHIEPHLKAFTLYGSGDFHFLTALWLRRIDEPFTLVSFDNHPDWDVRPPFWCCGTWINRALELAPLHRAAIWGCGNFELDWPHRIWANHAAMRADRLRVWPWAERISESSQKLWPGMRRENWRDVFSKFADSLAGEKIYVTVDLDCLAEGESVTNWENGLFTAEEIAWALGAMRAAGAEIISGDVCGAYSPLRYARWKQRIESTLDHPRDLALEKIDPAEIARRNLRALQIIWPALTAKDEG